MYEEITNTNTISKGKGVFRVHTEVHVSIKIRNMDQEPKLGNNR